MRVKESMLSALVALVALPVLAVDESAATFAEALKDGDFEVSLRYRFEYVDDDARPKEGQASTLRTTLAYGSKPYRGVSFFVEAEDVTDIGLEDEHNNAGFGSLANGRTEYATIADPNSTEINQAYVRIGNADYHLIAGRQEILLGNVRFVGNVGWRQNHQSYDAARFVTAAIPRTRLTLAYVRNVNRINGDNAEMDSILVDAAVKISQDSTLYLYGYELDYEFAVGLSTRTIGTRYAAKRRVADGVELHYDLEYADQQDTGDNPDNVDAAYMRAQVGAHWSQVDFGVGWEVLEGSMGDGRFTTPLATLHAWNGWADKFLGTPPEGLEDLFVWIGGKAGKVSLKAIYHDFTSDSESIDYGTELDFVATYKAPWGQTFGAKAALYSADDFSQDTSKYWLFTGYTF